MKKVHKRMNTSRLLWLAKRYYERRAAWLGRAGRFYLAEECYGLARWYGEKLETLG